MNLNVVSTIDVKPVLRGDLLCPLCFSTIKAISAGVQLNRVISGTMRKTLNKFIHRLHSSCRFRVTRQTSERSVHLNGHHTAVIRRQNTVDREVAGSNRGHDTSRLTKPFTL